MESFSSQLHSKAQASRILVTIPLYFRPSRLIYLIDVVRTLADFPVQTLTMMILTNTHDAEELETLKSLVAPFNSMGKVFVIQSVAPTELSFDLCWAHRSIIKEYFCTQSCEYTHFIYFEDDIWFSYQNFCYFLYGREYLRSSGLLPSFVRVEFNAKESRFYSTDQWEHMDFASRPHIDNGLSKFIPIDSVYNATYILDHELAYEFVNSRSFDPERSRQVSCWGIPERAALGLCVENIPPGYLSRYVVAVDNSSHSPVACSWIYHLPNNFTENESADNPFGKIAMNELFLIR